MVTPVVTAASQPRPRVPSRQARVLFADLMAAPPAIRVAYLADLGANDLHQILDIAAAEGGTPYCIFQDDPVGFVSLVLNESAWSKQNEALAALVDHRRVAVPSAFGTGKTHIAARAVVWRGCVYPPGQSLTVTTATRFRQVRRQLWPHIRSLVKRAGLPGVADTTQWKAPNTDGTWVDIAYGFSAPPYDETAVQGIHAPRLFLVVDEAGGIGQVIGKAMRGLLTGEHTRMLAIGNPPTDDEGSWFEGLCTDDEVHVVPISAYDSPNLSGEVVGACRSCPPEVPEHSLAEHLVDQDWVDETVEENGADSAYVAAKVNAKFPKGGPRRVIPAQWVEAASDSEEPPDTDDMVALRDLGLADETDDWLVRRGAWVRLGVDVAADGGDEFVIARSVGDLVTLRHIASGVANANPTDVAGEVLIAIQQAEALRAALGSASRVRVKVDVVGIGWGVGGVLQAWRAEGIHDADIVLADVRESTYREPDAATLRPNRKRDEMWLAGRALLTPDRSGGGQLRLRVDRRTASQLSAPMMGHNASGMTVIESKDSMKRRGISSPDRAEAVLLAVYEPKTKDKPKARLIV